MEHTLPASEYNRTSFTLEGGHGRGSSNPDFQPALHVGMEAPTFPLLDLDGQTVTLEEFRGKKHVVVEFGCITAPVFVNDLTALDRLYNRFKGEAVQFLIIYAREAHPGANYSAHASMEQKLTHARDLKRFETVEIPIWVDSVDGRSHRTYGTAASPVYIIDKEGTLVYKATWLIAEQLETALKGLLDADRAKTQGARMTRRVYSETLLPVRTNYTVHERVFERAGAGAREDVKKAFGVDPVELARKASQR